MLILLPPRVIVKKESLKNPITVVGQLSADRWPTFRYISLVCWHVVGNNNNYHCITIIIVQPSADLEATLEIWPVLFTGQ